MDQKKKGSLLEFIALVGLIGVTAGILSDKERRTKISKKISELKNKSLELVQKFKDENLNNLPEIKTATEAKVVRKVKITKKAPTKPAAKTKPKTSKKKSS